MLATISFEEVEERVACNRGLEAAIESLEKVESRNLRRQAEGLPFAEVDIALHVGEVLYGNVGAADRLDFTVIGPAVNEVVRMEKLCDVLDRRLLFLSVRRGRGTLRRTPGIPRTVQTSGRWRT